MDTLFGIAVVGCGIAISVVGLKRAFGSRGRRSKPSSRLMVVVTEAFTRQLVGQVDDAHRDPSKSPGFACRARR